jgi:alanine racemase
VLRALARDRPRGDLAQLRALLKAAAGDGTRLCAVVKADGYGHGAAPAARRR